LIDRHIDLQVAFIDGRIRPGPREQLAFRHQLARALDQRGQKIQRTASDTDRLLTPQQQLTRRNEPERPKGEGPRLAGSDFVLHGFLRMAQALTQARNAKVTSVPISRHQ